MQCRSILPKVEITQLFIWLNVRVRDQWEAQRNTFLVGCMCRHHKSIAPKCETYQRKLMDLKIESCGCKKVFFWWFSSQARQTQSYKKHVERGGASPACRWFEAVRTCVEFVLRIMARHARAASTLSKSRAVQSQSTVQCGCWHHGSEKTLQRAYPPVSPTQKEQTGSSPPFLVKFSRSLYYTLQKVKVRLRELAQAARLS